MSTLQGLGCPYAAMPLKFAGVIDSRSKLSFADEPVAQYGCWRESMPPSGSRP